MYPLVGATLLGTLEVGKSSKQVRANPNGAKKNVNVEHQRVFVFQEVLGKEVFTEAVAAAVAEG